ncbi:MAG: hypothetical protein ABIR27_07720 [Dokdonella sp.]
MLTAYLKDPNLLPELRFGVANQGVALAVIGNYRPMLRAMLTHLPDQTDR